MKSLFEETGGTYTLQGDYYFPNLALPAEENRPKGYGDRGTQGILNSTIKFGITTY